MQTVLIYAVLYIAKRPYYVLLFFMQSGAPPWCRPARASLRGWPYRSRPALIHGDGFTVRKTVSWVASRSRTPAKLQ